MFHMALSQKKSSVRMQVICRFGNRKLGIEKNHRTVNDPWKPPTSPHGGRRCRCRRRRVDSIGCCPSSLRSLENGVEPSPSPPSDLRGQASPHDQDWGNGAEMGMRDPRSDGAGSGSDRTLVRGSGTWERGGAWSVASGGGRRGLGSPRGRE